MVILLKSIKAFPLVVKLGMLIDTKLALCVLGACATAFERNKDVVYYNELLFGKVQYFNIAKMLYLNTGGNEGRDRQ